ncbi:metal ABC transporter permease [Alkalihalobacterium alkalinitrilicum]|uniref:metal ABC transporter permease n=1 Tax=Alkalihalobacterium alkalinitrilicum TaxID=427920 RepID=UPI00099592A1|nr:metal ABC transporter permease [Alkalihalobacterium alkalinitrilicum]
MIEAFLKYEFLQNAFYTGLLIGLIAPMLGVFLVVRRLSLIADALSHITLTGIAASLLLGKHFVLFQGLNPLYLGMGAAVGGSLLIEKLRNVYQYYKELAIPIILSSGIGIGVVLISLADGFNNDLFNYLFGSVITISRSDLYTVLITSIVVIILTIFLFKELFYLAFDEEQATVSGLNKKFIHLIFIISVALVIAASMRIVGILLVSALMTLPVAASMRLAKGFKQMFFYSILFGEIAVIGGLIAAFQLDLAPGGTIVILSVLILVICLSIKKCKDKLFYRRKPNLGT